LQHTPLQPSTQRICQQKPFGLILYHYPEDLNVDTQWKDQLLTLDHLKEGIGLRGYGQKDPLVEFKKEAFTLFEVEGAGGQRQNAVT
jgi:hypothetical protein